jgi:Bacterial Ig-like domain
MKKSYYKLASVLAWITLLGACSNEDPTSVEESVEVSAMSPTAGATNVDVGTTVSLTFSHPMGAGMEAYMGLYEGDLSGPRVPGSWMWSPDRARVEFHPDAPLRSQFRYTVHIGGAVQDATGRHLNYELCINRHGAQWAWGQMMGGHQPGAGWKHENGSYGVFYGFETR